MKVKASDLIDFTEAACGSLALVLHDLTGWPIYAEFERGSEADGSDVKNDASMIRHVWVTTPTGKAFDIHGTHDSNFASSLETRDNYADDDGIVLQISRKDLVSLLGTPLLMDRARSIGPKLLRAWGYTNKN